MALVSYATLSLGKVFHIVVESIVYMCVVFHVESKRMQVKAQAFVVSSSGDRSITTDQEEVVQVREYGMG